jgi:hypothetical protein
MLIDSDEVKQLLDEKAAISSRPITYSSVALKQEELSELRIQDRLGLLIQSKSESCDQSQ